MTPRLMIAIAAPINAARMGRVCSRVSLLWDPETEASPTLDVSVHAATRAG